MRLPIIRTFRADEGIEERSMLKCPVHGEYNERKATVRVCPKCNRLIDASDLIRLLTRLGFSKDTIEKVETEIDYKRILH